jgi:hypothetical protein
MPLDIDRLPDLSDLHFNHILTLKAIRSNTLAVKPRSWR